jgi:alanine racemase
MSADDCGRVEQHSPRARAIVDLAAVEHNVRRLTEALGSATRFCAVVKANAYGHGAGECARAALAAGADCLAVATADELRQLREVGIDSRIVVLGPLTLPELEVAVAHRGEVVAWTPEFVTAAAALGRGQIHVKLDTGMGRAGTCKADEADVIVSAVAGNPALELAGVMSHFATADEIGDSFFDIQLARFGTWVGAVKSRYPEVVAHAANSAATLRSESAHFDMVRCGMSVYGLDPFGADPTTWDLKPALALRSYVASVKWIGRGDSAGYGRRFAAEADTRVALLPIGHADGFRRALSNNADVLIDGRRFRVVGTVSMDSLTVDVGVDAEIVVGQDAVLIGADRGDRITAEELAHRMRTITTEVTCSLSPRVHREYVRESIASDERPPVPHPSRPPTAAV